MLKVKNAVKGGDQEEQVKTFTGKKKRNKSIPADAAPSGTDKTSEEGGRTVFGEECATQKKRAATQQQHSHWRSTTDSQNWDQSRCFPPGCT